MKIRHSTLNTFLLLAIIGLLILGCTTTPQGKSLDRSNYADIATTGIALTANEMAVESNPIGIALVPIKMVLGYGIEKVYPDNCYARQQMVGQGNAIFYGASVNNLLVAGSIAQPWLYGIAAGLGYYTLREKIEPGTYECGSHNAAFQGFVTAYNRHSPEGVASAFTQDAITQDGPQSGLAAEYAFLTKSKPRLWVLTEGDGWALTYIKSGNREWIHRIDYTEEGGLLSDMRYAVATINTE